MGTITSCMRRSFCPCWPEPYTSVDDSDDEQVTHKRKRKHIKTQPVYHYNSHHISEFQTDEDIDYMLGVGNDDEQKSEQVTASPPTPRASHASAPLTPSASQALPTTEMKPCCRRRAVA